MPRERLTWAQHRELIRRYLGDLEEPFAFGDDLLLQGWNASMDEVSMDLGVLAQSYTVVRFVEDLVAGQAFYALPGNVTTTPRVFRIFTARSNREIELTFDEKVASGSHPVSYEGDGYLPTYRLVGQHVRLDPAPAQDETGGLAIYAEIAEEGFSGDDSRLPVSWPILCEELLRISTSLYVFEQEQESGGDRGGESNASILGLAIRRRRYESKLHDFLERRRRSPAQAPRFPLGA